MRLRTFGWILIVVAVLIVLAAARSGGVGHVGRWLGAIHGRSGQR